MTETELEYQFCFNCNDRKQCYTKPKDCTRIQEEIGLQEMTNEEYLRSCTTEQLAEILVCMAEDKSEAKAVHKENVRKCVCWLKQPHTTKE